MNAKKLKKGCIIALILYVILAIMFYVIGGQQLQYRTVKTDMLNPSMVIGEITKENVFEQSLKMEGDILTELSLMGATYQRENTGTLSLEIVDLDGQILAKRDIKVDTLKDNEVFHVPFYDGINIPENRFVLRISAPEATEGNAVTLYAGNTVSTSRYEVSAPISIDDKIKLNGQPQEYMLCVDIISSQELLFGQYYWYGALAILLILVVFCIYLYRKNQNKMHSRILNVFIVMERYQYLIKQLVARDFKTKYKRSVLGIFWSFLNPLLTMLVQYVIFSTIFKSDIPNFAVYLLIGIVCYSFFSEATTMALGAIVSNATLITKVYVPKYIYPLTRVMSSAINFLLAMIPLGIVLVITRTPIKPAILLLPFAVICLFMLCLGIGMFLASSMVFFRDTQFLWGVVSMLWMYATPIFYPETIIADEIMPIYKCNPLYHVVRFIRIIIIDGVSPEPKAYVLCLITCIIPLLIGAFVFKKSQDKFILNL